MSTRKKPSNPAGVGGFQKGNKLGSGGITADERAEQSECRRDHRKHKFAALDTLVAALEATKLYGRNDTEHPDWPARIDAANSILDRGFGRPAQTVSDVDGTPMQTGLIFLPARNTPPKP